MTIIRSTPDNTAWTPADLGVLAYSLPPETAGTGQFHPGAGQVWLARCKLRNSVASAARKVGVSLLTAGNTLTNSFFGAYQFNGTNFVLLGTGSTDQSATLVGAGGLKSIDLGGPFAYTARDVFVALVIATATTLPKLGGSSSTAPVVNDNWAAPALNNPAARFMSGASAGLPATLDAAGVTWANALSFYCRLT